MRIQPFIVGPYGTCCYAVYGIDGNGCILIDAPYPLDKPLSFMKENGLVLSMVLLTHGHFDHMLGLAAAREAYPKVPFYLHENDWKYIKDGYKETVSLLSSFDPFFLSRYGSAITGMPEDALPYGTEAGPFRIIETPGHTAGSVCLVSDEEKAAFTGDTLFKGSVGRTDIGGDAAALASSISLLRALPDDMLVLPGHGPMSNIGTEKLSNPYMR